MKLIIDKHNFATAQKAIRIDATEDGHFKALVHYAVGRRLLRAPEQDESFEVKQEVMTADSEDAVRERTVAFLNRVYAR